ncbi:family 78 glycoside hydrolase catalytic domain [Nocardioides sp. C4-1]|uniref:family 78 glycoside hydrolase catalytic domain n=1 Tax=Nocardioides sp. C4-1 TaxID=3151851 RepID=UPI00326788B9
MRRPTPSPRTHRLIGAALALCLAATVQLPAAARADDAGGAADPAARADAPLTATGLKTNARVEPIGIPGAAPSLSWYSTTTARGAVQSAYQVRVAAAADALGTADLWDSGKVVSPKQVDVAYAGPALAAGTRYVWQVKVWDGADQASAWSEPASFETGLLTAGDWGSAEWIGAADGAELDRWSDYTADIDFDIAQLAIGVFLRAATTGNGYMWQISTADGTGVPKFRPHRRVNGGYALLGNIPIPGITSAQLLEGTHRLSITVAGSTITTRLDGTQIDQRTDATFARGFVGFRQDFADGLGDEVADVKAVKVTAADGTVLLDTDFSAGNPFDGGTLTPQGLRVDQRRDVLWRSPDRNQPMLRTDFGTTPGKTVVDARVYATARGIYELTLNGEKVGDQHLAPGWTDYLDRFQSQTYDVTDLVDAGTNALGAELGQGWWAGRIAHLGPQQYGAETSLLARLRITYTDGTTQWVDTDDATWTSAKGGYTAADLIDGESYDARLAKPGWDQPGYDDAAWTPAVTRTAPAAPVVPQPDEPVRTTEELVAVARTEPTAGRFTYDLGQNMVGVARMRLTGQAGQTVTIKYGEELNPDGTLYTANMRSAKVTDTYTFATSGTVTYEPRFTQHGFRYLEIVGGTTPPAAADVVGVVWGSDLESTGDLETSDPMLTQLISNISWGQRGNFLSIPTDTPARDERLGWAGDINVFAPTASYLVDTRAFLAKWMMDMRDTQEANGDYQGVAPTPPGFKVGTGTGWSDAGVTVPYAHWSSYGDISTARQYWADMVRFHDHLRASAGADLLEQGRNTWGDWLNLDDPTPGPVLGTASYALTTRMMSEMAAALGQTAYAAELAELDADIRAAFAAAYIADDGTVLGNSQTGYAIALGMDLVPEEQLAAVGAKYVAKLAASGNALTTGFLGTPWLLPALSAIDREDLAWTLLMRKDYPSWGYEVENGATTMWERWNSIMPDGSFGDVTMNSFNHYAYGAVGDWMYQNIGAIKALEPGYEKIRVAPQPGGGVTSGKGSLQSVYGPIATDWSLDGDDLSLAVDVPVGTTADVVLPADNTYSVLEGGAFLDGVDGVQSVVDDGDTVTVTVGSGSYDFDVVAGNALLGSVLEDLVAVGDRVADLADAGDLDAGDRAELDSGLDAVREHVEAALLATVDGADARADVEAALTALRELRSWVAGSSVDAPVRSELDGSLGAIQVRLARALSSAIGVSTALPPLAGPVLAGTAAAGTLDVTNDGTTPLTGLAGTVEVDGLGSATIAPTTVAPGQTVQLPVAVDVPAAVAPGAYDAAWSLDYTTGGVDYSVSDETADWVTVTSGLEVGTPTATLDGADRSEHATVTVPITNTGTAAVRAHVALALPAGWRSVRSADTLLPAGRTTPVTVPVIVPLDVVAGSVPLTAAVRRGADTLASREAGVTITLPRPPTAIVLDHVDFGDGPSESAHAVQGSASSGTSSEAGLTRRYAGVTSPGSSFSAQLTVPAGQPFILRNVETFDGAKTKKYDVFVDDVRVKTQLVARTTGSVGSEVYDTVVQRPAATAGATSVRVRFEYPLDAAAFYDPSIADTYVLAVPADTQAPDVSAVVASGTQGDAGWYRSDVMVAVDAADNRDAAPVVQTGVDDGWQAYAGPVALTGDGRRTLTYRATDAASNRGTGSLEVGIDATAPATQVTVASNAGRDTATATLTATDATSGVAVTRYRLDGGPWTAYTGPVAVNGFGEHLLEYASTDVAGNAEAVRSTTVTLSDVDVVTALLAPQVTGAARVGSRLTSTTGTWNTGGLRFTRQWLRNGSPIARATGASYVLTGADVGRRVSVRVTASKPGLAPGVAVSTATAPVAKAASRTASRLNRTQVKAGRTVKVTAVVVAAGVVVTGRVQVRVDGKVVRTLTLKNGRASTRVKVRRGQHRVVVRYLGSTTAAPSVAPARTVRGR